MKTVRMRATPSTKMKCGCPHCPGHLVFSMTITDEPLGTNPDGYYVGEVDEALTKGNPDDLARAIVLSAELADRTDLN